jgi:O-antigen/teichoic acid export membrane protein
MNLVYKSISGTIWSLLDIIFNKAVFFIATLILARLIGPAEFGLLGLIMIFVAIGNTLIDSGLSVSLVRLLKPDETDYSTVFYLNIILGFIAYLLIFFLAPIVADFYNQAVLKSLIRLYCLSFIINALRIIPQVLLIKEMNFKKLTILSMPGNIIGLILGIWMAMNGYKIWSIVGLHLSMQIVTTLMFWIFNSWRPKLLFSIPKMRNHLSFGYKLMLSAQLNSLFENIFNVIIGKYYSVQTLAYYERANTLTNYPVSILSGIINKISLPLFSNLSEDRNRILSVYRKILKLSFYISTPLMLGALVIAKPLVIFILGKPWIPTVPFFQILSLSYMLYPIHALNVNILSVYGRSDLFLKLEVIKKCMVLILIFLSLGFGIYGLLWSSVIASFVALFINTYYSGYIINYFMKDQFKDIFPTLFHSLMMALAMFLTYTLLIAFPIHIQLFITSFVGLMVYFTVSYFAKNESLRIMLYLIRN